MNRYQLAKLVEWAGTLESRKRLQKVVFLLKASGCPIEGEYTLHLYGPYSQEVARLSDEMVQVGLLKESSTPNQVGKQFSYELSESAETQIEEFERSEKGKRLARQFVEFKPKATELLNTELCQLEVASTIVYFRKQGNSWVNSVGKTCEFKKLTANTSVVTKAERLAREFVA